MGSIWKENKAQKKLQKSCKEKWSNILRNSKAGQLVSGIQNGSYVWLMLFVSLFGFCLFYVIPFVISFFYSLMKNPISREYQGFENYITLFHNPYFINGLKNTVLFMAVGIPCNMVLSFAAALLVRNSKQYSEQLGLVFLIPMVVPSATSAFFWKSFFAEQGSFNRFLALFHVKGLDWLDCDYSMLVMVLVFVWKNLGYNMALYLSGLGNIPEQYYEYAEMEGAGRLWKLKNITWTYLTPTVFFVLIMSFVNSFKIFKEIYLMTGDYPPDCLYVLQHYMNNRFLALDYPRLSAAVYILTIMIVVLIICIFRAEKKISDSLHD